MRPARHSVLLPPINLIRVQCLKKLRPNMRLPLECSGLPLAFRVADSHTDQGYTYFKDRIAVRALTWRRFFARFLAGLGDSTEASSNCSAIGVSALGARFNVRFLTECG